MFLITVGRSRKCENLYSAKARAPKSRVGVFNNYQAGNKKAIQKTIQTTVKKHGEKHVLKILDLNVETC